MHQQYRAKYPSEQMIDIQVVANEERQFSSWLGGSMLGMMPMFPKMVITKEDFLEHGPAIVHTKCF
eukprot:NODE_2508_length_468_cov_675.307876_g2070_i0.p1 GENE.NODE_2508_length_468_cov_675.307876_g2070_i0~~NODE_2508_length_468_cov_675.307876_g2070_i0.p1  ORF type:complete len:66 (+),score=10.00 NODE_2508_length_468_cov_675.307876_g2070_i0:167-364(+)